VANPLPLKDLEFIEFAITYLMLAPSQLQVDILGPNLDVPAAQIDQARIQAALDSVGFHYSTQIYAQYQAYFSYLVQDNLRPTIQQVNQLLIGSDLYAGLPPHPKLASGQSLASAFEALAGRADPAPAVP
jgi:hypothetical protein